MAPLLLVGRIAGAHGLRGLVKLQCFTADPAGIGSYGQLSDASGKRSFEVKVLNPVGITIFALLDGHVKFHDSGRRGKFVSIIPVAAPA